MSITIQFSGKYEIGTALRLLVAVKDETGDTDLDVPKGTIVKMWSDEKEYLIVETMDGTVSFPVQYGDVETEDEKVA